MQEKTESNMAEDLRIGAPKYALLLDAPSDCHDGSAASNGGHEGGVGDGTAKSSEESRGFSQESSDESIIVMLVKSR